MPTGTGGSRAGSSHSAACAQIETVHCFTLETIVKEAGLGSIDLLLIDVEGAEYTILESIDFEAVDVKVITVETGSIDKLEAVLRPKGYDLVGKVVYDGVFVKRGAH